MAPQSSPKPGDDAPAIPDRLYFKIGDVARLCGLEPYVLRFWESQFPQLKPNKSGTGQRLYRRRDVELALEIKRLVHGKGFTLAGARQVLEGQGRSRSGQQPEVVRGGAAKGNPELAAAVGRVRTELREIANLLTGPVGRVPRRRPRLATIASGDLFPS